MDQYLERFGVSTYEVPPQLARGLTCPSAQIVAAWYILQCQTIHTYISIRSCRSALSPTCRWDLIGTSLKRLLDVHTIPPTLLPLYPIGTGTTTVLLAHYGSTELVAIKQQVFSRGAWEPSSHVLAEVVALQALAAYTWAPQVLFQSVSQDMVQIGMEYLPLSMLQMVQFGMGRQTFSQRLIRQLLGATAALHGHNMVHRDIKPDNIRFRSNGELVLIDYDSSLVLTPGVKGIRHVGTAGYRDPFLSDTSTDVSSYDYRCLDAYSVGVVFLFILHGGKHLFNGVSDDEIAHSMYTYIHTELREFCGRLNLHVTDHRVLCGLLSVGPASRMTITEASNAYKSRE